MNYTKVELEKDFVRDTSTNAVLNINKDEINAARKRKLERRQKEKEFEDLKLSLIHISEPTRRM